MITEVEQNLLFAAIAFLERNDFKSIRQIGPHTLRASDGETPVYIWITVESGQVRIPTVIFDLARTSHSRIDVINFLVGDNSKVGIKHMMNVAD